MDRCKQCNVITQDFYRDNRYVCRSCYNTNQTRRRKERRSALSKAELKAHRKEQARIQKEWREANPQAFYLIQAKRKYGITKEQYQSLYDLHGGRCHLCKCEGTNTTKRQKLVIDHCHETGIVRGLLCYRCNLFAGYYEKNVEMLPDLMAYLKAKQ